MTFESYESIQLFSFCKIALIETGRKPRQASLMRVIFKNVFWKQTKRHVINHRSLQRRDTLVFTSLDQASANFQDYLKIELVLEGGSKEAARRCCSQTARSPLHK